MKDKGGILVYLKNRGRQFIPNIYHNPNMKNIQYIEFGSTLEKSDEIRRKNRSLPIGYHYDKKKIILTKQSKLCCI